MAVPKRKTSKQKSRQRQASNRYQGIQQASCPSCGGSRLPHRVCQHCGQYNGRQVLTVTSE